MNRMLSILGLATALVVLGGALASVAEAETLHFYAEALPATLSGSSTEDTLTTNAATVNCEKGTYTGSQTEEELTSVEVTPSYSGCTSGLTAVAFNANGCKYRLRGGEIVGSNREGTLDIVCPEGKQMAFVGSSFGTTKCTIDLPAQTNLGTVTYTNIEASATELKAALSIEKLKYSQTAGTGFGACTSGSAENGLYSSTLTLTGKDEGGAATAIAIMVPKPLFIFNPDPVDFKKGGVGSVKPVTIENKSKEEPKLNFFLAVNYMREKKCVDVTLKKEGEPGANCKEEMKCVIAGARGTLLVGATKLYAVNEVALENC